LVAANIVPVFFFVDPPPSFSVYVYAPILPDEDSLGEGSSGVDDDAEHKVERRGFSIFMSDDRVATGG
jgi:hypothetical protein